MKYGHILEFSIKHDNKTGNSRGFGFVIFKNVKSVEAVLREKSSHCIRGKWIDCKPAFQNEFNQYLAQNGLIGDNYLPQQNSKFFLIQFLKLLHLRINF